MGTTLSYNAPPLVIGDITIPGGLSINMDFGQTTAETADDAYRFLNSVQSNATGFLGNMIDGTQFNIMTRAESAHNLLDFIARGNQAVMFQDAALRSNVLNDDSGGGSYVCTAAYGYGEINDDELGLLNKFKNDFMRSTEKNRKLLKKYFLKAPDIVTNLINSPFNVEIFAYLKVKYISVILSHIGKNENEEALSVYCEMMVDVEKAAKEL
jgi:hypothetical protein